MLVTDVSKFVGVQISFWDHHRPKVKVTAGYDPKNGRIQYLRKYFHQNSVMYVPAPETSD